jgi:hypothetical protein
MVKKFLQKSSMFGLKSKAKQRKKSSTFQSMSNKASRLTRGWSGRNSEGACITDRYE